MRKQLLGLLAVGVLTSGLAAVPMSVSAASSANGNASYNANWWNWDSYWGGSDAPAYDAPSNNIDNDNGNDASEPVKGSAEVEKVIADGMKYIGVPYEFGSNRSTKTTFDCSDFMKWIFDETLNVTLPSDSRKQGAYVKEHAADTVQTDWHKLKRGDLMFFMNYEGSEASAYRKVDKDSERITHVGIYLGNGRILHTYSKDSGGVRTDSFEGTAWEHRFLFGGSAL
ncbi:C40 family peptidase [Cohnella sp. GCM10027633]|uniref:C40 family peptidase n=1 Tax=unclassified Cohnella TaxID=2636738 RepID=UPI003633ADED